MDESVASAGPWCEALDVLAIANANGWHTMSLTDYMEASVIQLPPDRGSAILVMCDPRQLQAVLEQERILRQEAAARKTTAAPVIAVLMCQRLSGGDAEGLVQAQRDLCASSVDDVVLNAGDKAAFQLAVSMAVARVQMQRAAMSLLERQVVERCHKELKRRLKAEQEKRREPKSGMFWQAAHTLFSSLPEMEGHPLDVPQSGTKVGPCVLNTLLGQGSFGQVWSATNAQTGDCEALKIIDKDHLCSLAGVNALCKEVDTMAKLEHPSIVRFRGVLHGPDHIILRMEIAGKCNMWRAIKAAGGRFSTEVAQRHMWQLSNAIAYLQAQGFAHRDLKPENLTISECGRNLKIIDLGSIVSLNKRCAEHAGTMPFVAPEVLEAINGWEYSPAGVDVWSAGVVLLEMLCGPGKLNRMLRWEYNMPPAQERADDLKAYFSQPRAIEEALRADLGAVDAELLVLLQGCLQTDALVRWSGAEVEKSQWLARSRSRGRKDT